MVKQSKKDQAREYAPADTKSVGALASRALSVVAERNSRHFADFDEDFADQLLTASTGPHAEAVTGVIDRMMASGIPDEIVADLYIPFVARKMGDQWCDDSLSFSRVTIGTARLQSALRSLGNHWSSYDFIDERSAADSIIIVVVRDSYHTLGAVVLAGKLRRLGMSVRLTMGPTKAELHELFANNKYDAALISANETETLASLRNIVDVIRQASDTCPPIIVGGSVVEKDVELKALTGADHITSDPIEALALCGLTKHIGETSMLPETKK